MNLSEFLLARIAEDEEAARAAEHPDGPETLVWWRGGRRSLRFDNGRSESYEAVFAGNWDRILVARDNGTVSGHIARHDPARVLIECEAKRRIVELHRSWPVMVETPPEMTETDSPGDTTFRLTQQIAWLTQGEYRKRFGSEPPTAPIMGLLVQPYADHPDFREEWRS